MGITAEPNSLSLYRLSDSLEDFWVLNVWLEVRDNHNHPECHVQGYWSLPWRLVVVTVIDRRSSSTGLLQARRYGSVVCFKQCIEPFLKQLRCCDPNPRQPFDQLLAVSGTQVKEFGISVHQLLVKALLLFGKRHIPPCSVSGEIPVLPLWIGLSSPVLTKTQGLKWSYRVMSSTWWWYQCYVMTHPLTWALIGLLCALGIGVAQDNIIYFPITFAMVCMLTEVWEGELRRFSSFQLIFQTLFVALDDVRWIVFLFEQLDDVWKNFNRVFRWFVWSGHCLRIWRKFSGFGLSRCESVQEFQIFSHLLDCWS